MSSAVNELEVGQQIKIVWSANPERHGKAGKVVRVTPKHNLVLCVDAKGRYFNVDGEDDFEVTA